MSLHSELTEYVTTLQDILRTSENEAQITSALEKKYGVDDVRLKFALALQDDDDKKGGETTRDGFAHDDDESVPQSTPTNKPVNKR